MSSQAEPFVENVRWVDRRTVFTTLHVPGSDNGLEPWSSSATGLRRQRREYRARLRADLEWLDRAFAVAHARRAAAVAVAMQADMWPAEGAAVDVSGYDPIVARLARRARAFRRPVLVLEGDSHRFRFDYPLRLGSAVHGVTTRAPNVVRIVVQGGMSIPHEWLRLRVTRTPDVFTWERVRLRG